MILMKTRDGYRSFGRSMVLIKWIQSAAPYPEITQKHTMPNAFESLFTAIVNDDRAKVKELLDTDPALTQRSVAEKSRLEERLPHWLYSGDTVLHVAAAGYRVEIARM